MLTAIQTEIPRLAKSIFAKMISYQMLQELKFQKLAQSRHRALIRGPRELRPADRAAEARLRLAGDALVDL